MIDETTAIEAELQSALSAEVSATLTGPPEPEDRDPDRIARIKALAKQFHRNAASLVLAAHRLGLELKALRDETPYGDWEKRFDTDLTFITQRRANDFIALSREKGFSGVDEV